MIASLVDDDNMPNNIVNTPLFSMVTKDKKNKLESGKNGDYFIKIAYRFCTSELVETSFLHSPGQLNIICTTKN